MHPIHDLDIKTSNPALVAIFTYSLGSWDLEESHSPGLAPVRPSQELSPSTTFLSHLQRWDFC